MTLKSKKIIECKKNNDYLKLTKIIKEAFKRSEEYSKKDLQNTTKLNFKVC